MRKDKDCCYREMTSKVGGQSQPQEYHEDIDINSYETTRKSFYGPNGVDWSGMEGEK